MDHRLKVSSIILLLLLPGLDGVRARERHRVIFYNVENLFDTRDDPDTLDDEFTPMGSRHWTRERYSIKIKQLSTVITAAGGDSLPLFVGLAEVENRRVLLDLVERTALSDGDYGVLHVDSPDPRGIDVALLYRKKYFQVLDLEALPVHLDKDGNTRDILYCRGVLQLTDTLHLFVCHFPSRIDGRIYSDWKRERAARVIREAVDAIQQANEDAAIIIMGDLNGAANTWEQRVMRARFPGKRLSPSTLYYLTGRSRLAAIGSYRYRGQWETIDHLIVSGVLLNGDYAWQTEPRARIFVKDFMLEEDKTHYGNKPFPTYRGPVYLGGFSDHLPVYLDLSNDHAPGEGGESFPPVSPSPRGV
ncbi:MAG: endonuclease/exonuclease/phosphatase family protein [Odoribacteraceae bacterium]|nr:endonuclease/exonuclease/phosphatase family protein [Odoribacteraceae bacterium]